MSNAESSTEGTGEASQGAQGRPRNSETREQITTLLLAVLIALSIRAVVVEPFRIPSGSMFPTLLIGDHLFVNKFIYGAKIPFTDYRLPALREPKRGDVVVFQVARISDRGSSGGIAPSDRRPDGRAEDFVKRIVGLPGDRIEVRDGMLIVNQKPVDTVILDQPFDDGQGNTLVRFDETVGECVHAALDDPHRPGLLRSPIVVEPGRYFMMGDNRDHSNDSRAWGTVRLDEFKGPAFMIYWSWNSKGNIFHLLNPINWFTVEKRWGRVLQRIGCDTLDGE